MNRDVLIVLLPPGVEAPSIPLPEGSLRVWAWITPEGLDRHDDLLPRLGQKAGRHLLRAYRAAAEAKIDTEVQP